MRHVSRMGVLLPPLLLIVASGCATKDWVLEEFGRQQAETRSQLVEMGQRIDQVVSETQRVIKRVDSVEDRSSQTDQKAESTGVRLGARRVVGDVGQRSRQRCTRARRRRDGQG